MNQIKPYSSPLKSKKAQQQPMEFNLVQFIELVGLLLFLGLAIIFGAKGCQALKRSTLDEKNQNNFDIAIEYVNNLRVGDYNKELSIKFDKSFVFQLYRACESVKRGEPQKDKPGIDCFPKPRICLKNVKLKDSQPYCRDILGQDAEEVQLFFKEQEMFDIEKLYLSKDVGQDQRSIIYISHRQQLWP
ncbi:hypothetical protein HYU13_04480 [Candidatus Woesearchaeota archaeon]|nr:hypothetical protein [Candidatus Woesearchaeota archaeon]